MGGSGDHRGGLEDGPFAYQETAAGAVMITWRGRQVAVLNGDRAQSFLQRVATLDAASRQQVMARVTGNFKRGNER